MSATTHRTLRAWLLPTVLCLVTVHCAGSGSPTGPGGSSTISAVTFTGTGVPAGSTLQGTVTLGGAAPAQGASVSLTSSNPAVATVPAAVTVQAGATNAAFLVTGVTPGTATITASMNGSSRQSPALTVGPSIAVASVSLSATTVVGGDSVTGTVKLTAASPQNGGAMV